MFPRKFTHGISMATNMSEKSGHPHSVNAHFAELDNTILQQILNKLSVLDEVKSKVDQILLRVEKIETNVQHLNDEVVDLTNAMSHMEQDMNDMQEKVRCLDKTKAESSHVQKINADLIDLSNRSRRNTVIIHNIPEGSEADETGYWPKFASTFFESYMKLVGTGPGNSLLVERAHRQPMGPPRRGQNRPRPIHVKLVLTEDRNNILSSAKNLKNNHYKGNNIVLTDSLHPETLKIHKQLVAKKKELTNEGMWAYIPFKVPRVLKYKDPTTNQPWQTYTVNS